MRTMLSTLIVAASVATAGAALAQTQTQTAPAQPAPAQSAPAPAATPTAPNPSMTQPAAPGPGNSAVNPSGANTSNQPVSGANSFTETQARTRIEGAGYTAVTDLVKDAQGVWRGKASKDGKQVNVSLDFQGNIIAN